jgi:hypothetical protein
MQDLIALTVQAVGGALASMANTREGAEKGAKIMLGGIIFQMGEFESLSACHQ